MSLHISSSLDREIEDIRQHVLNLGGLVEGQLVSALKVLCENDSMLTDNVLQQEKHINELEVNLDEECTVFLARRQPTATDLRFVMSVIKITPELERIGDEAKKIAKKAQKIMTQNFFSSFKTQIQEMGTFTLDLLRLALGALVRLDIKSAAMVAEQEAINDQQFLDISNKLIEFMTNNPSHAESTIEALWCARALERIGDHSRNICEHVIYLVTGEAVRHKKLEDVLKKNLET